MTRAYYDPSRAPQRTSSIAGRAFLLVGGLTVAYFAWGPVGRIGTGGTDTPHAFLVLAAIPPLVVAACVVAAGARLDPKLDADRRWRWAAAILLVCVLAPFRQLGPYGLTLNAVVALTAAASIYAAHARTVERRSVDHR